METQTPLVAIVFFALALWAVVAYYIRWIFRETIPKYDIVNELFHPAMQVIMAYMFLPLNLQVMSYSLITAIFVLCGLYFIIRILYAELGRKYFHHPILDWMVKEYKKLQYDRSHALLGFGTAYMFAPVRHVLFLDILFTFFFLWIGFKYILETYSDLRNGNVSAETRLCFILSDSFHVIMGFSMSIMNILMFFVPIEIIALSFFCWLIYRLVCSVKTRPVEQTA